MKKNDSVLGVHVLACVVASASRGVRGVHALMVLLALLCMTPRARALDQAQPPKLPSGHPTVAAADPAQDAEARRIAAQDRGNFAQNIKLDEMRLLAIQNRDQIKILDSWARQSLATICHRQKIMDQDPLYTALDMALRREAWMDKNIIYISNQPVREQLATFATDETEQKRIVVEARVSPGFLIQQPVQDMLQRMQQDSITRKGASDILSALGTFWNLFDTLTLVPPAAPARNQPWHHPWELRGNVPLAGGAAATQALDLPPALPGYAAEQSRRIVLGLFQMTQAWRDNDVELANKGIADLVTYLPQVNPAESRSATTNDIELIYNRSFNGTMVAFVYFVALVFFVLVAVGGQKKLRPWAVSFYGLALACHITAMAIRWYLAGRIPIQNQFESVLGSAMSGCTLGFILELWRKNGLFGMAMSFVGFLAMTACFVFPFVVGTDMGASIGTVAGILSNNVWLYIHVNIVIASYALIFASCVLGATFLGVRLWHWMNPIDEPAPAGALAGAGAGAASGQLMYDAGPAAEITRTELRQRRTVLEDIDTANMLVLQLIFWLLGVGIVCGAIWADVSWGRPWGWDPKETFALVTWIVYLMIVHVRFVTPRDRATVTAVLSIVGCAIMLFNWIGVNFWLVGLHSYA